MYLEYFSAILSSSPNWYKVSYEDGVYKIEPGQSTGFSELTLTMSDAPICHLTLSQLFQVILYDLAPKQYIQNEFESHIIKVFFNSYLPPAPSLEILRAFLQQAEPKLSLYAQQQSDDILETIRNQLKEVPVGKDQLLSKPSLNTYEDYLSACKEWGISTFSHTHWHFDSVTGLFLWTLGQIISGQQTLLRCATCGRYFVPEHLNTKYCSHICSYATQCRTRFCGDKEIENLYHKVYQALRRKTQSSKTYRYSPPNFSGSFQASRLFRYCHIPKNTPEDRYAFKKEDFTEIQKAFVEENRLYYIDFRDALTDLKNNSISYAEFDETKQHYMNWLANVRVLISAFEY